MKQTAQKMKAGVRGITRVLVGACSFMFFTLSPVAQAANLLLHYTFDEANGATTVTTTIDGFEIGAYGNDGRPFYGTEINKLTTNKRSHV